MKINRIRALIAGAARILWGEPVMAGDNFKMSLAAVDRRVTRQL